VGIRAVSTEGRRLGFQPSLSRHIAHLLITCVPLVGLLNHLWPLRDRRHQTFHDKLAGTLMVNAAYVPGDATGLREGGDPAPWASKPDRIESAAGRHR
jgi:uncharacterized RDD family membrane protein YckC